MLAIAPVNVPAASRTRPVQRPTSNEPRMKWCFQMGSFYPDGECPCWTSGDQSRSRELRHALDTWWAGFKVDHPEFALG
jgi:hypothetical protein